MQTEDLIFKHGKHFKHPVVQSTLINLRVRDMAFHFRYYEISAENNDYINAQVLTVDFTILSQLNRPIHGGCPACSITTREMLWWIVPNWFVYGRSTIFGPVFNIYIPEINLNIYLHMYPIDLVLNIFWMYSTYKQEIKMAVLFKNFLKNILWRILKNRFWIYSTIYLIEKQRTYI